MLLFLLVKRLADILEEEGGGGGEGGGGRGEGGGEGERAHRHSGGVVLSGRG